jgi:prevent-host-death family protein
MITVGIKELKAKLSSYVDKVQQGEEVVITDHGREVAVVLPISAERRAVRALTEAGKARWQGGKPRGATGIKAKGKPMAETVLEERR